jgi:hypothetical protein
LPPDTAEVAPQGSPKSIKPDVGAAVDSAHASLGAVKLENAPSLPGSEERITPRVQPPSLTIDQSVISDDYYRQHVRSLTWVLNELETRYNTYARLEVLLRRDSCAINTAIWVREQEKHWREDNKGVDVQGAKEYFPPPIPGPLDNE